VRRFCHRHDRQRSESRIRRHACPARAEWSATAASLKECKLPGSHGERVSNRSGGHCHVRAFYLSNAPGVRRLRRAKSVIYGSATRTEIAQKKVPIPGERDNALRWLRRRRERTIDSVAPLPVDSFEELIHEPAKRKSTSCSSSLSVRRQRLFLVTTKTGRQSPEGEVYARSRFSPCSECAVSVPPS
jgi:hypothetical protein